MVREDRRIAPRIAADLHVEFESFDEFVCAYTLIVSRTGLFIPTEKFLPAGAVVALKLDLPEGGPKIRAIARVAYTLDADKARETGRVGGMGMEFLDVEGKPFHDPAADKALFDSLKANLTANVGLVEMDTDINDPAFAARAVALLTAMVGRKD